jgi:TorA maturation chaperone TorD
MAALQTLPRPRPADATAIDRLLARSDAYRLIAGAFRDPDGPLGEDLPADDLIGALADLGLRPGPAESRQIRGVRRRVERGREHRAIFGHTVAHGCPAYETEYGQDQIFGQAQELADIAGFYGAFGLVPAAPGERPDHITCQLEFLGVVALKEALAVARDESEHAAVCRDAARSFLAEHLGRWLPALVARVAERAPGTGYAALIGATQRLVSDHAAELGVLPVASGSLQLRPVSPEADSFAFSCGVEEGDPDIPG